ncbi:MAG: N-formylglutamate amidohydrolase, partial [Thiohalocapsa sp.]
MTLPVTPPAQRLLTPLDPPAFTQVNSAGKANVVLICDHASNRMPQCLGTLGLAPAHLCDHIAWDPGAQAVAETLSALLDAPLVLCNYSRLVIDCNRPLASAESIPCITAGIPIPGNDGLDRTGRHARIEAIFRPYHDAIGALIDARLRHQPADSLRLLSIHSFTPHLNGTARPWLVGVSNRRQRAFAESLIGSLRERVPGLVGDNLPYGIDDEHDYSLPTHGERRGITHAMIEIRQDELRDDSAARRWAEHLASACRCSEQDMSRRPSSP